MATTTVPTTSVVILDKNFQPVGKVAGPFDEDSSVSLICDANEGKLVRISAPVNGEEMQTPGPPAAAGEGCKVGGAVVRTNSILLFLSFFLGNPLPAVHWWKGSHLIDTDYFVVNNSISRNVLTLANLTRDDLLMTLTCQAYNTNLTVAVSQSITLDLHRMWPPP